MVAIAVTGKGGVGKTFLVANLGVYFQRRGFRTLLIDGDLYLPKLAVQFGIHRPRWSLHNILREGTELEPMRVIYRDDRTGVHLIPGSHDIYAIRGINQRRFDGIAAKIRDSYDVTIIDTPVGMPFEIVSTFGVAKYQLAVLEPGRNPRKMERMLLIEEATKFKTVGDTFGMRTAVTFNKVTDDVADLVESLIEELDHKIPVVGYVSYAESIEGSSRGVPLLGMRDGEIGGRARDVREDVTLTGQFIETWINSFRDRREGSLDKKLEKEGNGVRAAYATET